MKLEDLEKSYSGRPEVQKRHVERFVERFHSNVDRSGGPDACWEWKLGTNDKGYGHLNAGGRMLKTHRVAYLLEYGEVDDDLKVCHTCDNPPCCRPDHLFQGTQADNVQDAIQKERRFSPCGEDVHSARFTEADIYDIRRRGDAGESNAAIGRDYGTIRQTIGRIVRRESWAWLPEELEE